MKSFVELVKRVIEKILNGFDPALNSGDAVMQLLGTLAIESDFCMYGRQKSKKTFDINVNGLSFYQMERTTFNWLKDTYKKKYPEIEKIEFEQLAIDFEAATIFARLRYLAVPKPLPSANDLQAQAEYWKQYYNASKYGLTVEDYIKKFNQYIK